MYCDARTGWGKAMAVSGCPSGMHVRRSTPVVHPTGAHEHAENNGGRTRSVKRKPPPRKQHGYPNSLDKLGVPGSILGEAHERTEITRI